MLHDLGLILLTYFVYMTSLFGFAFIFTLIGMLRERRRRHE